MILISYAICVCNESRELEALLSFLDLVRDKNTSEVIVLVDTKNSTRNVYTVLDSYPNVIVHECDFYGNFAAHKNFLSSKCSGRYIFNIDADEIPQEALIKRVNEYAQLGVYDSVFVPRINICPGYTEEFIKKHHFHVNNLGWINWPDYQCRLYKNNDGIKWVGAVHERIHGAIRTTSISPDPIFALWHIKSVAKQDKQNKLYDTINTHGEGSM